MSASPLPSDVLPVPARDARPSQRIVIYHSHWASAPALREELTREGFEVRVVCAFQEVVAWLMLYGQSALLILHPPAVDTFRRATLEAVRRVAPQVPLVAIVPSRAPEIASDLQRARVEHVLTIQSPLGDVVQMVRAVLANSARKESIPEERSELASEL